MRCTESFLVTISWFQTLFTRDGRCRLPDRYDRWSHRALENNYRSFGSALRTWNHVSCRLRRKYFPIRSWECPLNEQTIDELCLHTESSRFSDPLNKHSSFQSKIIALLQSPQPKRDFEDCVTIPIRLVPKGVSIPSTVSPRRTIATPASFLWQASTLYQVLGHA